MKNRRVWIERVANVVSCIALVTVAWAAADRLSPSATASARETAGGGRVSLSGVSWKGGPTVVAVLSTTCGYCARSSPLYRELASTAAAAGRHIVWVFPESRTESEAFLKLHGISATRPEQGRLADFGVVGTPALLLVNEDGSIEAGWNGVLDARQETALFKGAHLTRDGSARLPPVNGAAGPASSPPGELVDVQARVGSVPIIDTRDRLRYGLGHIDGAVSIPLAELEVRARHEVPTSWPVFVYCRFATECERRSAGTGLLTNCALAKVLLEQAGVRDVRILAGNLGAAAASGVKIAGLTKELD